MQRDGISLNSHARCDSASTHLYVIFGVAAGRHRRVIDFDLEIMDYRITRIFVLLSCRVCS